MNIESLRELCLSLPHVTEDVKWGADICFSIGGKMFCVSGFHSPFTTSFKVDEAEFEELSSKEGIVPAPYLARHKWVLVRNANCLSAKQWAAYITRSYELVKAKLSTKLQQQLQ